MVTRFVFIRRSDVGSHDSHLAEHENRRAKGLGHLRCHLYRVRPTLLPSAPPFPLSLLPSLVVQQTNTTYSTPHQTRSNHLGRPFPHRKRRCRIRNRRPHGPNVSHRRQSREERPSALAPHRCDRLDCGYRSSGKCGAAVHHGCSGGEVWDFEFAAVVSDLSPLPYCVFFY